MCRMLGSDLYFQANSNSFDEYGINMEKRNITANGHINGGIDPG